MHFHAQMFRVAHNPIYFFLHRSCFAAVDFTHNGTTMQRVSSNKSIETGEEQHTHHSKWTFNVGLRETSLPWNRNGGINTTNIVARIT